MLQKHLRKALIRALGNAFTTGYKEDHGGLLELH